MLLRGSAVLSPGPLQVTAKPPPFLRLTFTPPATPEAGHKVEQFNETTSKGDAAPRVWHAPELQRMVTPDPTAGTRSDAAQASIAVTPVVESLGTPFANGPEPAVSEASESVSGDVQSSLAEKTYNLVQHRRQLMTAQVLLGTLNVAVAPIEVHLLSETLLQMLQMASLAKTAIRAGDVAFSRCAAPASTQCSSRNAHTMSTQSTTRRLVGASLTAAEVLASGSCSQMVHDGLVRHKTPVLPASPPLIPAANITSGGLVVRLHLPATYAHGLT